ncbi:MAG: Hpt domain-containing protein [Burkholderiales bacterium]
MATRSDVTIDLLSWVKAEIDHALKLVRGRTATFLANSDNPAVLRDCPLELHQVHGALVMVGLDGTARVCAVVEHVYRAVLEGRHVSKSTASTMDRGVYALGQFLDDLARGEPNVPLKLFPIYRDFAQLLGAPPVAEFDLFFPDLEVRSPSHENIALAPVDTTRQLRTLRAQFQRGMLAWMRDASSERGLQQMQIAMDGIDRIAQQMSTPRGLWWTAVGFIDALIFTKDAAWLARAKPLVSRLDRVMRDIANNATGNEAAVFREMLYAIATCDITTGHIAEVRQLYRLDSLFPGPALPGLMEYDLESLQPALNDMRARLDVAKSSWVQYTSGDAKGLALLRDVLKKLHEKASDLGNEHLVRLLDVVVFVATRLPEKYPRQQYMIVEMVAMALMIEHILDTFTTPLTDLDQQVTIMAGWLLDAARGKSRRGEPPPGLRSDLMQQISDIQLRAQVAKEIDVNLQRIEQALELVVREPGKRASLGQIPQLIKQIHGALVTLCYFRADTLLSVCSRLIVDCVSAGAENAVRDLDRVAEGLSSLQLYVEPMLRGRPPADQVIETFLADDALTLLPAGAPLPTAAIIPAPPSATPAALDALVAAVASDLPPRESEVSPPLEVNEPISVVNRRTDKELLGVFLDEATQMLGEIREMLPACRERPDDFKTVAAIRRAFHTLKGSGRMVGLNELAEVAWEIEQLLNQALERDAPATPELRDLIERAHKAFSTWIAELAAHARADVHGEALVASARELKANMQPATPIPNFPADAQELPTRIRLATSAAPVARTTVTEAVVDETIAVKPDAVEPVAVGADEAPPAEVTIGDLKIPQSLYDVYLKEANEHLATLDREFSAWRARGPSALAHEFMRAAHTLASISRATGLADVAALAAALENWLPYAPRVTEPAQIDPLQATLAKLSQMIASVALRQPPQAARAEIEDLLDLTAELSAAPAQVDDYARSGMQSEAHVIGSAIASARQREQRIVQDDIDAQILPVFLEEAATLLPVIAADLRAWKAAPGNYDFCHALQRSLHTLKGSARMVGAMRLGELTHLLENRVQFALKAEAVEPSVFDEFETEMDRLGAGVDRLLRPAAEPEQTQPAVTTATEMPAETQPGSPLPMLRVQAATLDRMVNESGEITIARSRIEGVLRTVKQSLRELGESVLRLRSQLREVELEADTRMQSRAPESGDQNRQFDPLEFDRYTRLQELTRMMAESLHDVTAVQQSLLKNVGEADGAIVQQARVSRDLQQELMRLRTMPFSTLSERLYRILRQTARALGKKANLDIDGGQIELDRSVLEKIAAPLEHLLRNAIAHGLETPAERAAAGKEEIGEIKIVLRQEGNEIALQLSDDGAGIDLAKLRAKAIAAGMLGGSETVADKEALRFVFAAGVSTTDAVTQIAGRGVGLDVVRNEIASIGGRVEVSTRPGNDTTFTLFLPLTLAVTQALLVRAGSRTFAIPSSMVEQVIKVRADVLAGHYAQGAVSVGAAHYPLHYLGRLLAEAAGPPASAAHSSMLLLRSGMQRIALHVDEYLKNQEIVIKHIGPQLARLAGIAGATVLGDGSIVMILNPVLLSERTGVELSVPAPVAAEPATAPVIMVVDDSLTVRNITGALLEREGYRVTTAKDGIDALEKLNDALPDVMLLDIEMPRMDGFELAGKLRDDTRTRGIPIIMITSRTAGKHRQHAMQLGIDAFLGKPYQEAALLMQIKSLLGRKSAGAPVEHAELP